LHLLAIKPVGEFSMTRHEQEQAIGKDLELCNLIEAIGLPSDKRKARKHRAACMAQIRAWNAEDGLQEVDLDELMRELGE
jgi:hypothetical protein